MTSVTTQPPDSTAERLQTLARGRGLSMQEFIETLSVQAVADGEAEARLWVLAAEGDREAALAILDRLDDAAA